MRRFPLPPFAMESLGSGKSISHATITTHAERLPCVPPLISENATARPTGIEEISEDLIADWRQALLQTR